MDTYTINKAYPWTHGEEIEITSENLCYTELDSLSACQSNSKENNKEIERICYYIAEMIREIELLNK